MEQNTVCQEYHYSWLHTDLVDIYLFHLFIYICVL